MLLTPTDGELFFKLHRALMFFVNQRLKAVPDDISSPTHSLRCRRKFASRSVTLSDGVRRYLSDKFGDHLKAVRSAMQKLAKAYRPQELAHDTYRLYERFRPDIPAGKKGWGAKGDLDLELIEQMAKRK